MPRHPAPLAAAARVGEIATVLWAGGFRWLVDALGLRACVSPRCRTLCTLGLRPCEHHVAMDRPLPERTRHVLEQLGPTFVKAGRPPLPALLTAAVVGAALARLGHRRRGRPPG